MGRCSGCGAKINSTIGACEDCIRVCGGEPKSLCYPKEMADRFNEGKLKWSLVDFPSLEPLVKVLESGAKKYSAHNWKKGLDNNEVMESLLRHSFAILNGEIKDSESGESHIGHIMANAMFLSYQQRGENES